MLTSLSKIAFWIVTLVVITVLQVLKQLMKIYIKLTILNVSLEWMQTKNPSKPELFKTTLSTVFCINNKLLHCRSNWLRYDEHSIIWLQLIIFLNSLGEIFVIFKQYKFQERLKISREREREWEREKIHDV